MWQWIVKCSDSSPQPNSLLDNVFDPTNHWIVNSNGSASKVRAVWSLLSKVSLLFFSTWFLFETSIHWIVYIFYNIYRAAYKGNADTIRLLLFMDANQVRQDKNGTYSFLWCLTASFGYFICRFVLCQEQLEQHVFWEGSLPDKIFFWNIYFWKIYILYCV